MRHIARVAVQVKHERRLAVDPQRASGDESALDAMRAPLPQHLADGEDRLAVQLMIARNGVEEGLDLLRRGQPRQDREFVRREAQVPRAGRIGCRSGGSSERRHPGRDSKIRDEATATDHADPQRQRDAGGDATGQRRWNPGVPVGDRTEGRAVKPGGIGRGGDEQQHLHAKRRVVREFGGMRREHHEAGWHDEQQAAQRPAQQVPRHPRDRQAARESQQAQVEHRDTAHQRHETEDVRDLDHRVEPLRLAHERRQPAGFEVDQEGGADRLVHQRSSIVLPSTVMRSARSSPGSLRLG